MTRAWICIALAAALSGCATTLSGRDRCATLLDTAWQDLDVAKVEGFAGTVSYAKALGLLTGAKTQQALENFERCADQASRASFYIGESRRGR